MLEKLIENPTVSTIIILLISAIAAFVKGTVVSGASSDKRVADITAQWEKREKDLLEQLDYEREMTRRWMEGGMKVAGVADALINVAKSRDVRDTRDHQEREEREGRR